MNKSTSLLSEMRIGNDGAFGFEPIPISILKSFISQYNNKSKIFKFFIPRFVYIWRYANKFNKAEYNKIIKEYYKV